jgi:hypothetical protein
MCETRRSFLGGIVASIILHTTIQHTILNKVVPVTNWTNIYYSNGQFVAYNNNTGDLILSEDGIIWRRIQ